MPAAAHARALRRCQQPGAAAALCRNELRCGHASLSRWFVLRESLTETLLLWWPWPQGTLRRDSGCQHQSGSGCWTPESWCFAAPQAAGLSGLFQERNSLPWDTLAEQLLCAALKVCAVVLVPPNTWSNIGT